MEEFGRLFDKWNVTDEIERLDKMIKENKSWKLRVTRFCRLEPCRCLFCHNATSAKRQLVGKF